MPLQTQIGPYRIEREIGRGGMGVVFLARDTRLDRAVALKALPSDVASDPERLHRFEREARLLATLNHPNIATIYGAEEADGRRYLALEYIEGESLAARLARGALPLDETLEICVQIAAGIEAAHEAAIIHRDLKPANVVITTGDRVKVVDFGLARGSVTEDPATAHAGPDSPVTPSSPTITTPRAKLPPTMPGVILGTAPYLSPEQARGKPVDRRTDIWAFGCVVYECLTGARAFSGETVSDTISLILQRDPDWSKVPADTPAAVLGLMTRCLVKDPRRRLRDIGEARLALEDVRAGGAAALTAGTAGPAPMAHRPWYSRFRLQSLVAGIIGFLFAAAFWSLALNRGERLGRQGATREQVTFQVPIPSSLLEIGPPRVSPDGRFLLFNAIDSMGVPGLWLRPTNSTAVEPVPGSEGTSRPFWSADGRAFAFFAGEKLKTAAPGAPPRTICTDHEGVDGTWGSKGVILFDGNPYLKSVPATGGVPTARTAIDSTDHELAHIYPWFLPDGRHFLYLATHQALPDSSTLRVGKLGSKESKVIASSRFSRVEYARGNLFFVRDGTLMAMPFDAGRLRVTGEPVPVLEGVRDFVGAAYFSVSANGVLAYQEGSRLSLSRLVWMDRTGRELDTLGEAGNYSGLSLSPDGTRVAISQDWDIWVINSRGIKSRITFNPAKEASPIWSPDGSKIVFWSDRSGKPDLYQKESSGVGEEELLQTWEYALNPCDISRDGRYIAIIGMPGHRPELQGIWILPTFGERKLKPFLLSPFYPIEARFSPDGKWMAYSSIESGEREVYVQAFPGPGAKLRVSTQGGRDPQWRGDGKELFFLSPNGEMMSAEVRVQPTFEIGTPRSLFAASIPQGGQIGRMYAVSADGQRFLVRRPIKSQSPITVVLNWEPRQSK